jgi:hypothetical protein
VYANDLNHLVPPQMEEIRRIVEKYDEAYFKNVPETLDELNALALMFYKDVADIYDAITRIKNPKRNPMGFSLDDAPVLGLLVRVWKLLKEIIKNYEERNAEIISILDRPLLEASVVATYLMMGNSALMEDYRKCSYKDRLRVISDLEKGAPFYQTKAGKRLLDAVYAKMAFEHLTPADFEAQKAHRWRIEGKTFYEIFATVAHANLYASTYGIMSESIHGSWNESLDWGLAKNSDGSFSAYPFQHAADVRYITPMLSFTNPPFRMWLQRIDAYDESLQRILDWIDRVNAALFREFDEKYNG